MRPLPYSSYKSSGDDWLGEVPEHWDICRLKRVCRLEYGDSLDKDSRIIGDIAVYGSNGVVGHHNVANTLVPSIVVGRKGSFGKVNYSHEPAFAIDTTFFVDARFSRSNLRWLYYLLGMLRLDAVTKDSAIPGLDRGDAYSRLAPLPKKAEQTTIARFLDHATDEIERYIHAKEKMIALLEEQKQVMIHDAVTGRIDVRTGKPYPAYKPTGIEWLGKVPSDWKVQRVKSLFRLRIEKSGSAHGRELLSIYTHIGVRPRKDLEEKGNKASTTDDYWIVKKGDLIANKLLAWMGAIGVSHYEGVTSPAYDILMPTVVLESDYYHHLFRTKAYLQQFKQRSRGIMDMRLRLYFDQFGQIPVPVPPVEVQRHIINWYNDASIDINHANNDVHNEIELLREYRTRLIADVVTGKLDVREAAANLPDLEAIADGGDNEAPPTVSGVGS